MSKDQRTKIFFDAFPLIYEKPSGIGHLIAETVSALEKIPEFTEKFRIVLLAPKSGLRKLDRWGFTNCEYRPIPVKGKIWNALVLYRLLPPADLFFGKGVYVFGNYTTWPLLFSRCVTFIHDLNFYTNPHTVNFKTLKVLKRNVPLWIKRADQIATISQFSKQEIARIYKVPENKIEVVLCGVNKKHFYPRSAEEISEVKNKLNIEGDYLLFLSNIEPRKNIDRLLSAYVNLPEDLRTKYSLVLIGADGWNNSETLKRISKLQKRNIKIIRPNFYVEDDALPAILSGATALLHPALYEGFGLSPLQAMACGTPVVVSNNTSIPEVVGSAGVYVNELDEKDISAKIELLLRDKELRKKLAALGQQRAKQFNWEKSAGELSSLIRGLLE